MGNSQFEPQHGRGSATGVFCKGYVETKGDVLAPQVGFEPTTLRLTAERLIAASRCKHKYLHARKVNSRENWGDSGGSLQGLPSGIKQRDLPQDYFLRFRLAVGAVTAGSLSQTFPERAKSMKIEVFLDESSSMMPGSSITCALVARRGTPERPIAFR